jgi:actin-like ATPase involved in cell morphogenesis
MESRISATCAAKGRMLEDRRRERPKVVAGVAPLDAGDAIPAARLGSFPVERRACSPGARFERSASPMEHWRHAVTEIMNGLDLGSAWTVVHNPERGVLLGEPTLVARDGSGRVLATGRRALSPAIRKRSTVSVPVRRGLVVNPADCVHLLTDLFSRAAIDRSAPVRVAIPAGATPYDVSVVAGVVFSATGRPATIVPSLLAGVRGAGIGMDGQPVIVCDIGAGLTEIGVVHDDRLVASWSAPMGARDYERNPLRALRKLVDLPHQVLERVPAQIRSALADQPVNLIGGGASIAGLTDQLAAVWRRQVERSADVRHPVAVGLLPRHTSPIRRPEVARA